MKAIILYHGKCADGFTAAWIANKALRDRGYKEVTMFPAVYGDAPPDVVDAEVYILDFSYKRLDMHNICMFAKHVVWLDHHKSAIEDCGDMMQVYTNLTGKLSVDRCGAWLTWEWFHGEGEVPTMIKLVDDRDRWQFLDPRTKPFAAGLFSRHYTVENWDEASTHVDELIADGMAIDRKEDKDIAELLDVMVTMKIIDGYVVPTANLSYMSASKAGAEMLARFPAARLAATYFLRHDDKHVYSLRSRNGSDTDVSAIAKKFGGGGHMHAAGFAIDAALDKGALLP